jgi:hypothetical protein
MGVVLWKALSVFVLGRIARTLLRRTSGDVVNMVRTAVADKGQSSLRRP